MTSWVDTEKLLNRLRRKSKGCHTNKMLSESKYTYYTCHTNQLKWNWWYSSSPLNWLWVIKEDGLPDEVSVPSICLRGFSICWTHPGDSFHAQVDTQTMSSMSPLENWDSLTQMLYHAQNPPLMSELTIFKNIEKAVSNSPKKTPLGWPFSGHPGEHGTEIV